MGERKRGRSFPGGLQREEAKLLGPYPTWDGWKYVIENRLGISFKNSEIPEDAISRFYRMRRLQQKAGQIDQEEVNLFWEEVEEEHPDFLNNFGHIVYFIIQRTPIKKNNT